MLHVRQRHQMYRFFSQLFRYPDTELIETLNAGRAEEIGALVQTPCPDGMSGMELELLQQAYTELFIARQGGLTAPPYGSVYLDEGQLMGPSTLQVARQYQTWRLELEADGEPPDFLPTELEFLYFLVNEEISALSARDTDRLAEVTGAQRYFLAELLLPWLEVFGSRLPGDAHSLYTWGASALLAFVRQERAWLEKLAQTDP